MIRIQFYLSGIYFDVVKTTSEIFNMLEDCTTNDFIICNTIIEDESSIKPLKHHRNRKYNPCLNQGVYIVSVPNDNLDLPNYTHITNLHKAKDLDLLDVVYVDHQYVLDYERVHCM